MSAYDELLAMIQANEDVRCCGDCPCPYCGCDGIHGKSEGE